MAGKQDDDTLRTQQQLWFLYAVSEGTINKITNIYADEIPIEAHTIDFAYTKGAITQSKISGFDYLAGNLVEHGELVNGTPLEIEFTDEEEFAHIIITLPDGLYWHTPKDNIRMADLKLKIYTSDSATGGYVLINNHSSGSTIFKHGKSMGSYTMTVRVERPATIGTSSVWRVKIERVGMPPSSDGGSGDSYTKNTTLINSQPYQDTDDTTYPGTALVALRIEDASQVGNKVPTFAFEGEGMRIKVPSLSYYDPQTRQRTGTWDGTFEPTKQYCNNLAWVLYNLRSNALDKYIPTEYFIRGAFTSITRSGTTATVHAVGHGRTIGERIFVSGSPEPEYNGTQIVTAITASTFDFEVTGTPANTSSNKIRFREMDLVEIGVGIPESQIAKYTYEAFAKECDKLVFTYDKINKTANPVSVVQIGNTLVITYSNHLLTTGQVVQIQGAFPDEFNVAGSVTVINVNSFTMPVAVISPIDAATGNINLYLRTSEPKYQVDGQFLEIKDSDVFLTDFLTIGNAQFTQINGLDSIIWDRKWTTQEINNAPIFTNQNVIDGIFEYSGSYISEFTTQVNTTIQAKEDFNKTKTVVVESYDLVRFLNKNNILPEGETFYTAGNLPKTYFVDKYGLNISDILFAGVASNGAAVRKGKTILWDMLMNNLIVSFTTVIEGAMLYKGQLIRILDADIYNTQASGRIKSYTSSGGLLTLSLDRDITLSGVTEISLYIKNQPTINVDLDDTIQLKTYPPQKYILNETTGLRNIVTIDTTDHPIDDSIFVVQFPGLLQTYTVVSSSLEDGKYVTTCIKYDLKKYDYIEEDFLPPGQKHIKVKNLLLNPVVITTSDITVKNRDTFGATALIQLKWLHDATEAKKEGNNVYYKIYWEVDSGQRGNFTTTVTHGDFIFHIPTDEDDLTFTFSIVACSDKALRSYPVTVRKTYLIETNPATHDIGMVEG